MYAILVNSFVVPVLQAVGNVYFSLAVFSYICANFQYFFSDELMLPIKDKNILNEETGEIKVISAHKTIA